VASVQVMPGVCGLETHIISSADDMFRVTIQITSQCAHIQQMAEQLGELSAMEELRRPIHETTPYQLAGRCGAHVACPVPSAILKALEVAAGLALPRDVHILISQDETEPSV
jgi:hypothetical protein